MKDSKQNKCIIHPAVINTVNKSKAVEGENV